MICIQAMKKFLFRNMWPLTRAFRPSHLSVTYGRSAKKLQSGGEARVRKVQKAKKKASQLIWQRERAKKRRRRGRSVTDRE